MRRNRLGALSAAVAMSFAVSAPGAQAQVSDDVIRIGVLGDQSGVYADNCGPGQVLAARLAVEDAGGEINGKKIEVVVADDRNKPDIGVARAQKWVESEGVDAILACSISSISLAVKDIMAKHKKPFMLAGPASADLTNSKCAPTTTQWAFNTYTMPKGVVSALIDQGLDTWYFITVDYAFGKKLQEDAIRFVEEAGGKVVGSTLHPLNATDFSSQLLQAQASGAKVIGIANSGADLANLVKQSNEFGIAAAGQQLAPLAMFINIVHGIGLEATKNMVFTSTAYWDQNDATRAISERYAKEFDGRVPNEIHLATYSAINHYLKSVAAAGTDDGDTVMAKMRATPVNDAMLENVSIRDDGVVHRPMLTVRIKEPGESKAVWDYYDVIGKVAADNVWPPLSESECPLVKK